MSLYSHRLMNTCSAQIRVRGWPRVLYYGLLRRRQPIICHTRARHGRREGTRHAYGPGGWTRFCNFHSRTCCRSPACSTSMPPASSTLTLTRAMCCLIRATPLGLGTLDAQQSRASRSPRSALVLNLTRHVPGRLTWFEFMMPG